VSDEIFIDWLTASQHHSEGGLPIVFSAIRSTYDTEGVCRSEHAVPASVSGSFDTAVRVGCNGSRVFISGNVGRFGRADNLFNHGWAGTLDAANRILEGCGLPPLSAAGDSPGQDMADAWRSGVPYGVSDQGRLEAARRYGGKLLDSAEHVVASPDWFPIGAERYVGARISRLDITANFSAGSDAQARAVIRWLGAQSMSRLKRGIAGDESVWWANTQRMFKAYLKAAEMVSHGASADEFSVVWCREKGVVRVEIELKRRLLADLGLDRVGAVSDAALLSVFKDQTELLRRVDRSDAPDLLASLPARYRMTCAAWLAGQDVRSMMAHGTFWRHAKVLREYGVDIAQARNVEAFPLKVRVIELKPLAVPDWYEPLMRRA